MTELWLEHILSKHNQALGRMGEQAAAQYLVEHGYRILAENARTPHGELDLIAELDDELVFVEVKTRSSTTYGYPEEAVTPTKLKHMWEAAQYLIAENWDEYGNRLSRFDVLAIRVGKKNQIIEIVHIKNVQ